MQVYPACLTALRRGRSSRARSRAQRAARLSSVLSFAGAKMVGSSSVECKLRCCVTREFRGHLNPFWRRLGGPILARLKSCRQSPGAILICCQHPETTCCKCFISLDVRRAEMFGGSSFKSINDAVVSTKAPWPIAAGPASWAMAVGESSSQGFEGGER